VPRNRRGGSQGKRTRQHARAKAARQKAAPTKKARGEGWGKRGEVTQTDSCCPPSHVPHVGDTRHNGRSTNATSLTGGCSPGASQGGNRVAHRGGTQATRGGGCRNHGESQRNAEGTKCRQAPRAAQHYTPSHTDTRDSNCTQTQPQGDRAFTNPPIVSSMASLM
jgi:hypothetical protein